MDVQNKLPYCILEMEHDPRVLIKRGVERLNEIARETGIGERVAIV